MRASYRCESQHPQPNLEALSLSTTSLGTTSSSSQSPARIVKFLEALRPHESVAVAVALPVASNGTVNEAENVPLEVSVTVLDPLTAPLSVTVTCLPGVNPWPLTVML